MAVLEAYKVIITLFPILIKVNTQLEYSWTSPRHSIPSVMTFLLLNSSTTVSVGVPWIGSGTTSKIENSMSVSTITNLILVLFSVVFPRALCWALWFLLINDIAYASNLLSFFIYADDTNAILSHPDRDQLISSFINSELSKILI